MREHLTWLASISFAQSQPVGIYLNFKVVSRNLGRLRTFLILIRRVTLLINDHA